MHTGKLVRVSQALLYDELKLSPVSGGAHRKSTRVSTIPFQYVDRTAAIEDYIERTKATAVDPPRNS